MRAKKIFYLQTPADTYVLRNDLYNTGVRWDSKARQWWAPRKAPVKRALELVGEGSKVVEAVTVNPPRLSKNFRGGRPRGPRSDRGKPKRVTVGNTPTVVATALQNGHSEGLPVIAPVGQPFVRKTVVMDRRETDRRSKGERRGPGRPVAVLCVPVVPIGAELQKAG